MSRRDDLVQNIRESYALGHDYEAKISFSDDPKEKARSQRAAAELYRKHTEFQ